MRTHLPYYPLVFLILVFVSIGVEGQETAWAVSQEVKIEKVEVDRTGNYRATFQLSPCNALI